MEISKSGFVPTVDFTGELGTMNERMYVAQNTSQWRPACGRPS
jgi:hypothetical protein